MPIRGQRMGLSLPLQRSAFEFYRRAYTEYSQYRCMRQGVGHRPWVSAGNMSNNLPLTVEAWDSQIAVAIVLPFHGSAHARTFGLI